MATNKHGKKPVPSKNPPRIPKSLRELYLHGGAVKNSKLILKGHRKASNIHHVTAAAGTKEGLSVPRKMQGEDFILVDHQASKRGAGVGLYS